MKKTLITGARKHLLLLFILISAVVLISATFYFSENEKETKDLLAKQEGCVRVYEKVSDETPKTSVDRTGISAVENHVLYSQKQKSCIEALSVNVTLFEGAEKSNISGYFSVKDIYTGENYFFQVFTSDEGRKEAEIFYKSKLYDLGAFGSKKSDKEEEDQFIKNLSNGN